jgi:hypothetical protein
MFHVFQRAVLEQELALLYNDCQSCLAGIMQWPNLPLLHKVANDRTVENT